MRITDMKPSQFPGNTKAFFKVETEEGFVIDGFKVMDGKNGLFVSPPSRKGGDKYYDTVTMSRDLKQTLTQLALDEFRKLPDAAPESDARPSDDFTPGPGNDLPF